MHIFSNYIFIFYFIILLSITAPQISKKRLSQSPDILISMSNALDDVEYKIQNEIFKITNISSQGKYRIMPSNINFFKPICQEVFESKTDGTITKTNCIYLIQITDFDLFLKENQVQKVASYNNLLCEIKYSNIVFKFDSKKIVFDFKLEPEFFNFNKQISILNGPTGSDSLKSQMHEIGNKLNEQGIKYTTYYLNEITLGKYNGGESFVNSVFNVGFMKSPYLNIAQTYTARDNDKEQSRGTYISYINPIIEDFVITARNIFVATFTVSFEYAIDYDVNYNFGQFVITDFKFSKSEKSSYSNREFLFSPNNLGTEMEKHIVKNFFDKLEDSKTIYLTMTMDDDFTYGY